MLKAGLLVLAVIVAACNTENDFEAKTNEAKGSETYTTTGGAAEAATENSESAASVETLETTQAISPIIVAGASLTCVLTAEVDRLGCRIPIGANKFYKTNPAHRLEWSGLTTYRSFPLTAVESYDGDLAGTQFFVPIGGKEFRAISLRMTEGDAVQTLTFALKDLPASIVQSYPVPNFPTVAPGFSELYFLNGSRLGDGKVSNENDSCQGTNDITFGARTASSSFSINLSGPKMDLYLEGLCGLQNPWTYFVIDLPPPFKQIRVSLTANVGKVLVAKNVEIPSGQFVYRLAYEDEYAAASEVDDFSISSLVMIKN